MKTQQHTARAVPANPLGVATSVRYHAIPVVESGGEQLDVMHAPSVRAARPTKGPLSRVPSGDQPILAWTLELAIRSSRGPCQSLQAVRAGNAQPSEARRMAHGAWRMGPGVVDER